MNQVPHRFRRWTWSRRAVAGTFLALLILGRFDWFPWVKGSMTATSWAGVVPLVDPLAALEVTLASRTLTWTVLVGAGLLVLFAALLGPVFCGWVCPLGLLLDLNNNVRERVARFLFGRGIRLPTVRVPRHIKFGILAAVLAFSLVAQVPVFQTVSPINLLAWGVIFAQGPGLVIVFGILLLEYVLPRGWCRALCPLGALYSLVGRAGFLRVRVGVNADEAAKIECRECTLHCPMGIAVREDYVLAGKPAIDHPECLRCGNCIDMCPQGALSLGFRYY